MTSRVAWAVVVVLLAGCAEPQDRTGEGAAPSDAAAGGTRATGRVSAATQSRTTRPTDVAAAPGLPAGWEMAPTGNYTAKQEGGEVKITAKGQNPTPGYEVKLMQSMLRIWPPQYVLIRKKPGGMAAQVMTPFEVSASFKAAEAVKQVVVRDGMGRHEVAVGQ